MEKIIGRDKELGMLAEIAHSSRSEFVAVYGRRRVGKTFLVRRAFNDKFVFYATGVVEGSREDQLAAFNIALELVKEWLKDNYKSLIQMWDTQVITKLNPLK